MIKINAENIKLSDGYVKIKNNDYNIIFSTAENNKNFNRHTEEGTKTLNNLTDEFSLENVIYVRQVHGDRIVQYNSQNKCDFIEEEADAIITNVKDVAIGVFTADCVPIIIIDKKRKAMAAIHSGWKGTFLSITKKTIKKLESEYGSKPEDLVAYIGPHIRQCCYEVSNELKEKFINEKKINIEKLFRGRNLSMEECILKDLRECGVGEDNIYSVNLCTYCCEDIKLHSYRKSNGDYSRMFSFVILK